MRNLPFMTRTYIGERPRRLHQCWPGSRGRTAIDPPPPGCPALAVPQDPPPEILCGWARHLPHGSRGQRGVGARLCEAGSTRREAARGGASVVTRWLAAARAAGGATGAGGARWCSRLTARSAADATSVRRAIHRFMAGGPRQRRGRRHGAPRTTPLVGLSVGCPSRVGLFLSCC